MIESHLIITGVGQQDFFVKEFTLIVRISLVMRVNVSWKDLTQYIFMNCSFSQFCMTDQLTSIAAICRDDFIEYLL